MSDAKSIVDKLWNFCSILPDDVLSYGDYVEQRSWGFGLGQRLL